MMNLLKVSRRTVYRELENLETSLNIDGRDVGKIARGRFSIQADESDDGNSGCYFRRRDTGTFYFGAATCDFIDITANKEPISMHYFLETYCMYTTFMPILNN